MFNPAISILRVFSMTLIVFTHYLSWEKINCFQISTVGVSIFLLISGFLYGMRNIVDKKEWMEGRVKKVLVPFWILSLFLVIFLFINSDYLLAVKTFFVSLLNLQGLNALLKISFSVGNMHISGLGHCWFLTIIMLCYLLVCLIKQTKIERIIDLNVKKKLTYCDRGSIWPLLCFNCSW